MAPLKLCVLLGLLAMSVQAAPESSESVEADEVEAASAESSEDLEDVEDNPLAPHVRDKRLLSDPPEDLLEELQHQKRSAQGFIVPEARPTGFTPSKRRDPKHRGRGRQAYRQDKPSLSQGHPFTKEKKSETKPEKPNKKLSGREQREERPEQKPATEPPPPQQQQQQQQRQQEQTPQQTPQQPSEQPPKQEAPAKRQAKGRPQDLDDEGAEPRSDSVLLSRQPKPLSSREEHVKTLTSFLDQTRKLGVADHDALALLDKELNKAKRMGPAYRPVYHASPLKPYGALINFDQQPYEKHQLKSSGGTPIKEDQHDIPLPKVPLVVESEKKHLPKDPQTPGKLTEALAIHTGPLPVTVPVQLDPIHLQETAAAALKKSKHASSIIKSPTSYEKHIVEHKTVSVASHGPEQIIQAIPLKAEQAISLQNHEPSSYSSNGPLLHNLHIPEEMQTIHIQHPVQNLQVGEPVQALHIPHALQTLQVSQHHVEQPVQTAHPQEPVQTVQYHQEPVQTVQYHQEPVQTAQYHQEPVQTVQYHQEPVQTVQYHQEPVQTVQYHQEPVQSVQLQEQQVQTVHVQHEPVQSVHAQEPVKTVHVQEPVQSVHVQEPVHTVQVSHHEFQTLHIQDPIKSVQHVPQEPVHTVHTLQVGEPVHTLHVAEPIQTVHLQEAVHHEPAAKALPMYVYSLESLEANHQPEHHVAHQVQVELDTPLVTVTKHESHGTGEHHLHYDGHEEYASQYRYGYRVRDHHTGSDFGHMETREGKMTKGQYFVSLPDGRLQNVEYWADPSGYHATVSYTGQAHHPSH